METFVKSDIFFFISTICFVVLTILLVWFLVYAISIAKDVKKLSRRIEREGERIADDIEYFRESAKDQVVGARRVLGALFGSKSRRK